MTRHPKKTADRVREPVQVYLAGDDVDLLARLAGETNLTKAELLRRGLRSLARELSGPSPMRRFVAECDAGEWSETVGSDHDAVLAAAYRGR